MTDTSGAPARARVEAHSLLVIYTERLDACREFYDALGLPLVREQHGNGPVHYAAEFPNGFVLELYPARSGQATGRLRLGFTLADSELPPGEHLLTDPDGRTVAVTVADVGWRPMAATTVTLEKFEQQLIAAGARVDTVVSDSGAVDVTVRRNGDIVCVQGAGSEWGCSMNWSDDEAWTGHDQVFGTLDAALTHVMSLIHRAPSPRRDS